MIESKRHDVGGLSPWKPLRLTISIEKVDRFLADIQRQVEDFQQLMTNLRLVRTQLAAYQQEHGSDEEQAPYVHSALVGMQSNS